MPNLHFIAVSLSGYAVIAAAITVVDIGHATPLLNDRRGMFSFVLLLGMGMSGATVESVMVILWAFATGTSFASYSAAAAG